MLAVEDGPDEEPGIGHHRAWHTGLPVTERPLGVEDVRGHRGPRIGGSPHLLRGGIGVPDRHHDAVVHQPADRLERAITFWGQGDGQQDLTCRLVAQQLVEGRRRGIEHALRAVAPLRTSEMNGPSRWTPRIRQTRLTRVPDLRGPGPVERQIQLSQRRSDDRGLKPATPRTASPVRTSSHCCGVASAKSAPKEPLF